MAFARPPKRSCTAWLVLSKAGSRSPRLATGKGQTLRAALIHRGKNGNLTTLGVTRGVVLDAKHLDERYRG